MLYLDASALVKLVAPEPESEALAAAIEDAAAFVSSVVAAVEVRRAAARVGADGGALERADRVMGRVDLLWLDADLLERAARLGHASLGTLDAIHLASALSLGDELAAFVAYDDPLRRAAEASGLPVSAPA